MLMRPNATQSAMMTSGLGTRPAIVGGVRKMPLPMVMPTMSAVPLQKPMTLRRSCVTADSQLSRLLCRQAHEAGRLHTEIAGAGGVLVTHNAQTLEEVQQLVRIEHNTAAN